MGTSRSWAATGLTAALFGLAGCGGGGGGDGSGGTSASDPVPLTGNIRVTAISPGDEAVQVATDAAVQITFDAPIHQGSVESDQITLAAVGGPPLLGSIGLAAGNRVVTFTPSGPLAEATDYVVTVGTQVFDTNYRTLAAPSGCRFRTVDTVPPTVVLVTPGNGAVQVPPRMALRVEFSEALDPGTVGTATVKLRDAAGTDLPLTVTLDGAVLVAVPMGDLRGGRHYGFAVKGGSQGVQDRSGNPLAEDLRTAFDTGLDATPPEFMAAWPPSLATGVAPSARLRVRFDDSIDPWSVEPTAVILADDAGSNLPLRITWSPDGRIAVIAPAVALTPGASYLLGFPPGLAGICNRSSVPLATSLLISFQAGQDDEAPRVMANLPAPGQEGVAVNVAPLVVFSRPLFAASVGPETVELRQAGRTVACALDLSLDRTRLTVTPAAPLQPATAGELRVRGGELGVLAENFLALGGDLAIPFTTTADPVVPTVVLYPANGSGSVAITTAFVALFSEPVAPDTVTADTVRLVRLDTAATLAGRLTVEQDGRVVRLTPDNWLPAGKPLCFSVAGGAGGVKDRQGNWLAAAAQSSVTAGYHVDGTPPVAAVTLCGLPDHLNDGLQLAPFGFTIDVSGYDPGDAAVDPTSIRIAITGDGGSYPGEERLFALAAFPAQDRITAEIPPALLFAAGPVAIRASLADLSGNRSAAAEIAATVGRLTMDVRPLEKNQVVLVDFATDREGRGRGDGVADWYQDLADFGLVAAGDPLGRNRELMDLIEEGILAKANELYGRGRDGTLRAGAVAIRFVRQRPPAGIPFMHMALGGQDPEGGKRALGEESTGILGRAWFDLKNGNWADNNAGTSPGLGIFPGELFLYQANLYQRLYPGYVTAFGRRFRLLSPLLGGTPAGAHAEDPAVLAPTFDFAAGTAAQRSRYLAVFEAADDLAVAAAALLAHEVGHSLGLVAPGPPPVGLWGDQSLHVEYAQPQDLMNAVVGYDGLVEEAYRFRSLSMAYLREQILLR